MLELLRGSVAATREGGQGADLLVAGAALPQLHGGHAWLQGARPHGL